MRKDWSSLALACVIAQIPFELRYTLLGLSNLQWTFLVLVAVSAPLLIDNWKLLIRQRLVQAASLFVAIQWVTAFLAPEFHTNAVKAAVRLTAGLLLLAIAFIRSSRRPETGCVFDRVWVIAASAAAAYALLSYAGFGLPWLFRDEEFYIGQVQRLSGSFEYPNTAAAYFAMSLPIVWWSSFRPALRGTFAFLLWCAVNLTLSRGALAAIPLAVAGGLLLASSRGIEWRRTAALLGLGIAAYGVLLPVNPYLIGRLYGPGTPNPIAAEYRTPWNKLQQQPGAYDQIPLQIRNTGSTKWRSRGLWRTSVGYRWFDMESEKFIPTKPIITELPHTVDRGETIDTVARFQMPAQSGKYLLVLEPFSRDFNWFSQIGVIPALIQVDVLPGITRAVDTIDLSDLYHREESPSLLTASVPRAQLWRVALSIFLEHPSGIGPDNYRLEYGKYLGAAHWDTNIHSNNLFLEILTGSGIFGLTAFGLVLLGIRWRFSASCLAIAIFLIHGVVDVFLTTTPIYFAFWLLAGTTAKARNIPLLAEEGWTRHQ